ncbi:MAG: 4-hydroxy-tetrahydrodipicolinate reductase [Clostridia bacterium]|nr:4-hydroxy-tetrahydrodipicolinate reductase [Clostridia bacterium]
MTRLILSGAGGRMGRILAEKCRENDIQVVAGVDIRATKADFPVYSSIADVKEEADVVIDFSHPSSLPSLLTFSEEKKLPLILCATGYSEEDIGNIRASSALIPIFRSANMSLGVNVLVALVRKAAEALEGFDVEITEMHHNKKLDAPSGTANMLLKAVTDADEEKYPLYDRHPLRRPRDPKEVGMHSLRGGTVVGDHSVIFAGQNETLTISHSAESREVFAMGAVRAILYMQDIKAPRLYDMNDVIGNLL